MWTQMKKAAAKPTPQRRRRRKVHKMFEANKHESSYLEERIFVYLTHTFSSMTVDRLFEMSLKNTRESQINNMQENYLKD